MRERRHLHGCLSHRDFLLRLAPRRLGAILCAKAAEAVFASRAGSSLRDARLSQALFLPPPSRPHAECVTRRRRVGAGESRPCISPAPRSGNPAGEMTDAPTPTRRKSSIIVGRNATSNEKQGISLSSCVNSPTSRTGGQTCWRLARRHRSMVMPVRALKRRREIAANHNPAIRIYYNIEDSVWVPAQWT